MAKTDKERFDATVRYFIQHIGADLALSITDALRLRADEDIGV